MIAKDVPMTFEQIWWVKYKEKKGASCHCVAQNRYLFIVDKYIIFNIVY